jgi:hypothetical protein
VLISFSPVLTRSLYYLKSVHRYEYKELRNEGGGTLNVYTGQNPRQHVLMKTSQMHTICSQFGRKPVCLFTPMRQLLSKGWQVCEDLCFFTYLINHTKLFFKHLFQLCRQTIISIFYIIKVFPGKNLVPQRLMRLPLPSQAGTYYTYLAGFI